MSTVDKEGIYLIAMDDNRDREETLSRTLGGRDREAARLGIMVTEEGKRLLELPNSTLSFPLFSPVLGRSDGLAVRRVWCGEWDRTGYLLIERED